MKLIILTFIITSNLILANTATDKVFNDTVSKEKFDASKQAYCYLNAKGETEGINSDMKIRLASTSKLITSLWAIQKLGITHTFDMKIFIKNNQMHIQGSREPFLGNEKMMYLVSQLNKLGYTKFDKITF